MFSDVGYGRLLEPKGGEGHGADRGAYALLGRCPCNSTAISIQIIGRFYYVPNVYA